MNLTITEVDSIPERIGARGPRASFSREVFEAAETAQTQRVSVTAVDKVEAERVYKQLMQYRMRHGMTESFGLQKFGLKLFVWKVVQKPTFPPSSRYPTRRFH